MNPMAANPATIIMNAFERDTEQRTIRTRPTHRKSGFRARVQRRPGADQA